MKGSWRIEWNVEKLIQSNISGSKYITFPNVYVKITL